MEAFGTMSDEALCLRAAQGCLEAEEVLVSRYGRLVRICARPYFLLGGDSEDLLQEGMVGVLKAVRSYRPDGGAGFHTYAERCISNALVTAVRAAACNKHTPLNTYVSLESPLFDENSDFLSTQPALQQLGPERQLIDREEVQERLDAIRSQLSGFEARVLGSYLSGLSYSEIALQVDRPIKSVDNAIQRVRRKIQRAISPSDSSES